MSHVAIRAGGISPTLLFTEEEVVEKQSIAHGLGQETTINDVNKGLIDDLIEKRLKEVFAEGYDAGFRHRSVGCYEYNDREVEMAWEDRS